MTITRIIDVSSAGQGVVPVDVFKAEVVAGVLGMYARCGNGNDAPDADFAENAANIRNAGAYAGAYDALFPLPDIDPVAQAEQHFEASGGLGKGAGELPVMGDLEWPVPGTADWTKYKCTTAGVRAWALAWLQRTQELTGKVPLLYVGYPDYWKSIGGASEPAFAQYRLWAVAYPPELATVAPTDDRLLMDYAPWPHGGWTMWQHSAKMRLSNGMPVDGDVFHGDAAALATFCGVTGA